MNEEINIIFPNQLFKIRKLFKTKDTYIIEENLFLININFTSIK